MKPAVLKLSIFAFIVLYLSAFATPGRAQSEAKQFGKIMEGPNSVTVKASRTALVSHGVKTLKRQLEIIVYRPYDTQNYYSDEHYADKDIANLHTALLALAAQYAQWKGKRLGTQTKAFEVRKGNDSTGVTGITIALQMDESGKISLAFTQGDVGVETTPANLAKLNALTSNAIAWLASPAGATGGKSKPAK